MACFLGGGKMYTVPMVTDFPRYNMKCGGENEYYVDYFIFLVFLFISCYIAEILITFWTV